MADKVKREITLALHEKVYEKLCEMAEGSPPEAMAEIILTVHAIQKATPLEERVAALEKDCARAKGQIETICQEISRLRKQKKRS